MANTRKFVFPSGKTKERSIRGRLYYAMRSRPSPVAVLTRSSALSSLPFLFAESVLSGAQTQPHIHNCTVSVTDGRNTIYFEIFFKRHIHLPINRAIPQPKSARFRGDMLIMRVGVDGEQIVNMRACDRVNADWVVRRAAARLAPIRSPHALPKFLDLYKRSL